MYTIGQVSEMFSLPISTIRYYDKMGLIPGLERTSGTRRFGEEQLESLRVIECLKRSGLEIRDIRQFMEWCQEGPDTYHDRLHLFEERQKKVDEKIAELERTRAMISWKLWYYRTAEQTGSESFMEAGPEGLPEEGRQLWKKAHQETGVEQVAQEKAERCDGSQCPSKTNLPKQIKQTRSSTSNSASAIPNGETSTALREGAEAIAKGGTGKSYKTAEDMLAAIRAEY